MKNPFARLLGYLLSFALFAVVSSAAHAQLKFKASLIETPVLADELPIAPDGPIASAVREQWNDLSGQRIVRNVVRPSLIPVLPEKGKSRGKSVIVLPGGGFAFLSIDNEGLILARKLADEGVDAYVLKYRLSPTPENPEDFAAAWMTLIRTASKQFGKAPPQLADAASSDDLLSAVKLVRELHQRRHGSTGSVGAIGFSAGAMVIQAVLRAGGSAPLDHAALIYGPMLADTAEKRYPPMFLALANDDSLFSRQGFGLVQALQERAPSVELHLYESGSHGFGTVPRNTASDRWLADYLAWLGRR